MHRYTGGPGRTGYVQGVPTRNLRNADWDDLPIDLQIAAWPLYDHPDGAVCPARPEPQSPQEPAPADADASPAPAAPLED